MIRAEPLKGKLGRYANDLDTATKEDIRSAVEWLKKTYRKQKGFFEMDELIDEAFEDVMK